MPIQVPYLKIFLAKISYLDIVLIKILLMEISWTKKLFVLLILLVSLALVKQDCK